MKYIYENSYELFLTMQEKANYIKCQAMQTCNVHS